MSVNNSLHPTVQEGFKAAAKKVMRDEYVTTFSEIYNGFLLLQTPFENTIPCLGEYGFQRVTINYSWLTKNNEMVVEAAGDVFRSAILARLKMVHMCFEERKGPLMEEAKKKLGKFTVFLAESENLLSKLNPEDFNHEKVIELRHNRDRVIVQNEDLKEKIKHSEEVYKMVDQFINGTQQLLRNFESVKGDLFTSIKGRNIISAPSDEVVLQFIDKIENLIKDELCPLYDVEMSPEEVQVEGPAEPCSSFTSAPQPEVVIDVNSDPFLAELKARLRTR